MAELYFHESSIGLTPVSVFLPAFLIYHGYQLIKKVVSLELSGAAASLRLRSPLTLQRPIAGGHYLRDFKRIWQTP